MCGKVEPEEELEEEDEDGTEGRGIVAFAEAHIVLEQQVQVSGNRDGSGTPCYPFNLPQCQATFLLSPP